MRSSDGFTDKKAQNAMYFTSVGLWRLRTRVCANEEPGALLVSSGCESVFWIEIQPSRYWYTCVLVRNSAWMLGAKSRYWCTCERLTVLVLSFWGKIAQQRFISMAARGYKLWSRVQQGAAVGHDNAHFLPEAQLAFPCLAWVRRRSTTDGPLDLERRVLPL